MNFKNWLESKGIRLNPQIRKDLSRSIKDMDGFYDGSGDEKSTINTINPYTNQPMEIPLNFRHDPNGTYDARFNLKDKYIDVNKRKH
jgi:hypothetical protein